MLEVEIKRFEQLNTPEEIQDFIVDGKGDF